MSTWNSEQSNQPITTENALEIAERSLNAWCCFFFPLFFILKEIEKKKAPLPRQPLDWVGFYPEYKPAVPGGSWSTPPNTTSWPWLQRGVWCPAGPPQSRVCWARIRPPLTVGGGSAASSPTRVSNWLLPQHDLQAFPYVSFEAINLHLSWRFLMTGEISYLNLYYSVRDHFIFWIKQKPLAAGKQQIF